MTVEACDRVMWGHKPRNVGASRPGKGRKRIVTRSPQEEQDPGDLVSTPDFQNRKRISARCLATAFELICYSGRRKLTQSA